MDFLRDPIWQFVGVILAAVAIVPILWQGWLLLQRPRRGNTPNAHTHIPASTSPPHKSSTDQIAEIAIDGANGTIQGGVKAVNLDDGRNGPSDQKATIGITNSELNIVRNVEAVNKQQSYTKRNDNS